MPTISPSTYEDLVHRHHAAVYRSAHRVLGHAADAADVTQQVFVRVWAGRVTLPGDPAGDQRVLRWLAVRLGCNHLRGRRRRRRLEEERARMRPEARQDPDPVQHAETRAVLSRALAELPDALRVPLVLRFHEELSFTDLAVALRCSKSSAHASVQRGLDALRQRLRRLGHAAPAAGLPAALGRGASLVTPPPGLAEGLLAAGTAPASAGLGVAGKLVAVLLVVGLAGGAAWAVSGAKPPTAGARPAERVARAGGTPDPAGAAAGRAAAAADSATTRRSASTRRPAAAGHPPAPAAEDWPRGRVRGRVVAADGAPLAGARVLVTSLEYHGKGPRFRGAAASDSAGRFEVAVPVAHAGGQGYAVRATREAYAPDHSEPLRVHAERTHDLPPLQLRPLVADTPGAWSQRVLIRDSAGRPVDGARVVVERIRADADDGVRVAECSAATTAGGVAQLTGTHCGEKRMEVQPPSTGPGAVAYRYFGVAAAGALPPRVVTLDGGRSIRGVVRTVDDGSPVAGCVLRAVQPDLPPRSARSAADGSFTIDGLSGLPITLCGDPPGHARFRIEDVAPGARDLVLAVKRRDDARAHGLHLGELHGRIVDADSGEPVAVRVSELRTHWLSADPVAAASVRREVLPGLLAPPPVQLMLPDGADFATWTEPRTAVIHETGLRAGHVLLLAWSDDHAVGWAGPFAVGPGVLHRDIELRLQRGGTVVGQVLDASGEPEAGAVVWVGGRDSLAATPLRPAAGEDEPSLAERAAVIRRRRHPQWRTDAAGTFEVPRLPPRIDLVFHALGSDDHSGHSAVVSVRDGERRELGAITLR